MQVAYLLPHLSSKSCCWRRCSLSVFHGFYVYAWVVMVFRRSLSITFASGSRLLESNVRASLLDDTHPVSLGCCHSCRTSHGFRRCRGSFLLDGCGALGVATHPRMPGVPAMGELAAKPCEPNCE
jgi:hypothetical protein